MAKENYHQCYWCGEEVSRADPQRIIQLSHGYVLLHASCILEFQTQPQQKDLFKEGENGKQ